MDRLDGKTVVLTWILRGIEDFFTGFKIEQFFSRYRPFFCAMGFEMVCKGYLLGIKASEYEGLEKGQAIARIDTIAKDMGHNVKKLAQNIDGVIGKGKIAYLLDNELDGFTGHQFLEVIESAYLESRYPVPNPIHEKFPVEGKEDIYWEPLYSSGFEKFCYAFSREILASLKLELAITIPKLAVDRRVTGKAGVRFCNLFFAGRMEDFVSN